MFGDNGDDTLLGVDRERPADRRDRGRRLGRGRQHARRVGPMTDSLASAEADILFGGTEEDFLNGGRRFRHPDPAGRATTRSWAADGDDSLLGGTGVDTLNGGNGNDTLDSLPTDVAIDTLNGGGWVRHLFPSLTDPDFVVGHSQTFVTADLDGAGVLTVDGTNASDDGSRSVNPAGSLTVTGNGPGSPGKPS